jgi:hypothetical protein
MTYPIVLGQGKRLFSDPAAVTRLELLDTRPCGAGVLLHSYRSAR